MMFVRRTTVKQMAAGFLLLLACGCEGELTRSPSEGEATRSVTVRLDWLLRGHTLPLVVAQKKGFYSRYGIDVTLSEGRGDSLTCELVSNGRETVGLADASTGALAISKGAAIKYVAVFVQKTPSSIIFYPDQRIETPEDLKGKRGGISSAGAATVLLKAVLGQHGIDENQINLTAMAPHSKQAALLGKKVDYINGYLFGDYISAVLKDPDLQAVPYYEWNINALSTGLIVHPDTIENHPDLVQNFVTATVEGWHYTLEHPAEAGSIGVKYFPMTEQGMLEQGVEATRPLLHTSNSEGRPLGWMAEADWRQTVQLMYEYGGSDPPLELDRYFTNQFVESR